MSSTPPPDADKARLGVLVCGHGSRDIRGVAEFAALVAALKLRLAPYKVAHGYLEFATPTLSEGLDALRAQGVTRILAVPGMLFAAAHAKNDIPALLNRYAARHPRLQIDYGRELGIDARMLGAAAARIEEALARAGGAVPAHETLLLVVGRGASDPDANSNVAKVMRMLWEGLGFGWGETAYSGVTFPLVEPALQRAARLGFKRVMVFPYFLFTGVLVERIYAHTDEAAQRFPDIEFVKAPYLGGHALVVETFAARVEEILHGDTAMNCSLCKYRLAVPGFEAEVGLPQQSHHHHVEGLAAADGHAHGHGHDPDHGRPPYPHAAHPLGPASLKRSGG